MAWGRMKGSHEHIKGHMGTSRGHMGLGRISGWSHLIKGLPIVDGALRSLHACQYPLWVTMATIKLHTAFRYVLSQVYS